MLIPYVHGDGRQYGCGEVVISTHLLDEATGKSRAAMDEHKKACWAKDEKAEKKRG
jgi:hypothetical protein